MSASADTLQRPPAAEDRTLLLPSDRFVVRSIPLAGGSEPEAQALLALESISPFPAAQLYYGWWKAADRLLVYGAYRKRFSAEETVRWVEAEAVLPGLVALLGDPPSVEAIRLLREDGALTAAAWDGSSPVPAVVLSRGCADPSDETVQSTLLEELRTRAGFSADKLRILEGPVRVRTDRRADLTRIEAASASQPVVTLLSKEILEGADVRDRDYLRQHRGEQKRARWLWRVFAGALGALAALLLIEAGLLAAGWWLRSDETRAGLQAAAVGRIETAQSLSNRVAEITRRRLLPFEMLDAINQPRPASIRFSRVATLGTDTMEIEAQTPNAGDVARYESALRALPTLAQVEARDLRSRDGVTSFELLVVFKPAGMAQLKGAGP